jgi:hypothetical protein
MSDTNNRRHPPSTFEAEYPYNQATVTRGGHEFHINDTPDKESLRIAHTKGSYVEIDKDGRTVVNSVGKAYYYMCDGFSTTVDGHYDLKVKGVMNINVDGSVSEETAGNRYTASGGNFVSVAGGNLTEKVVGDRTDLVGGKHITRIKGNESKNIDGKSVTKIADSKTEVISGNWLVTSGGDIEIINDGSIRFKCKNFIIDAESITFTTAGDISPVSGDVTINSKGQVNSISVGQTIVTASRIILNG